MIQQFLLKTRALTKWCLSRVLLFVIKFAVENFKSFKLLAITYTICKKGNPFFPIPLHLIQNSYNNNNPMNAKFANIA